MKMWDGRFSKTTDCLMEEFNNSLSFDIVFIEEDIAGSIAWANALESKGVIAKGDRRKIVRGLKKILNDFRKGTIKLLPTDEDVHMAVERLLIAEVGDAGARLHTGRSRNDQVSTAFRLYMKRKIRETVGLVVRLQKALLQRAGKDIGVIVPGYTHLQQAQPVSLAHYWLSFLFLLEREKKRCMSAFETADIMPLGSGAVAGSGFHVDRKAVAKELNFSRISENSMDAVSSRDFVLDALSALASLGISCSRYAEDLIIWSSREFGFIELDDAWSTGSSMMPQKKNPDSLELIRGKAGRFIGNYTRIAATLKGVGLTYYKDLQEDKEPVIDGFKQMALVLNVFTEVVRTLSIKRKVIEEKLDPFLIATDIADYLVRKKVPFRQAHKIVGAVVEYSVKMDMPLDSLSIEEFRKFSDLFEEDVKQLFHWDTALAWRDSDGGTGPESIKRQIRKAKSLLKIK